MKNNHSNNNKLKNFLTNLAQKIFEYRNRKILPLWVYLPIILGLFIFFSLGYIANRRYLGNIPNNVLLINGSVLFFFSGFSGVFQVREVIKNGQIIENKFRKKLVLIEGVMLSFISWLIMAMLLYSFFV